jgi:hypothetical protein
VPIPGDSSIVTVDDFKNYIDDQNVNVARASLIIRYATQLCQSIVDPLPAGAEAVILDVAQRAYAVPPEGVGPYATPPALGIAGGGLWLTRANEEALRRLAGARQAPIGSFPPAQAWPDPLLWPNP